MKTKLKLTLIWSFTIIMAIVVFVGLVEVNDKQKVLNKLKAKESALDEEITFKLQALNEVSSLEYQILEARKRGFGFKGDRRFEEK